MKRRNFIKKAALATAGTIGVPYILPTGRLFASTAAAMSEHVVLVLFAGGVRNQETVYQRYLAESQGLNIEGNILYNMLSGDAPELKIVYGTQSAGGQPGGTPIDQILSTPLDQQGTLFPEMRYTGSYTGHYTGLSNALSGYYETSQGLQSRPLHPTIFEYLRRHAGMKATDTWFIGNSISSSTPLLNYSAHRDYGSDYAANFFAPTVTFGQLGDKYIKGFKTYHPEEELDPVREMRAFLDQAFLRDGRSIPNLNNTEAEIADIKAFIKNVFDRLDNDQVAFPPVADNGDLKTIGFAAEVMRWFKPRLTVVNMSSADSCHGSFTNYLGSLHRGDHGIGFLWDFIQNQTDMAGKTTMLVMPEHGRNYTPNAITDENDWVSFDHDSDENSRRIFSMMVGPGIDGNLRVGSESNPIGDAADITPTIADIFGIKNQVMNAGLVAPGAMSLFDRI